MSPQRTVVNQAVAIILQIEDLRTSRHHPHGCLRDGPFPSPTFGVACHAGCRFDRQASQFSSGDFRRPPSAHAPCPAPAIRDVFAPERLVLRLARTATAAAEAAGLRDGSVLHGPPVDGPVRFREAGLWFQADVVRGQKARNPPPQRGSGNDTSAHTSRVVGVGDAELCNGANGQCGFDSCGMDPKLPVSSGKTP